MAGVRGGLAGVMNALAHVPKRLLVGRPLSSTRMGETLLPKKLALPVFCSDPLSSNAYATEEILLMLSLGGVSLLTLTPWVAAVVVLLLVVVVAVLPADLLRLPERWRGVCRQPRQPRAQRRPWWPPAPCWSTTS